MGPRVGVTLGSRKITSLHIYFQGSQRNLNTAGRGVAVSFGYLRYDSRTTARM